MEELYLLDEELNKKHIIDTYSSIIWTPRYNNLGDCELVIQASQDNFKKIYFSIFNKYRTANFFLRNRVRKGNECYK